MRRHAETSLYARFPESPGAPPLAAIFRRDHVEFAQLVESSRRRARRYADPLAADVARDLRRILYGMYALMKLHFAAEESVYERATDQKSTASAGTGASESE